MKLSRKENRTRCAPAAHLAACAVAVFFSTALVSVRAADLPPALTLNVPVAVDLATPAWLGHPTTPARESLPTLDLPITPPDANAALLVTVYFQESDTGFLRVIWNGPQGAVSLADNFYENIGMANQRSLLIPPSTLGAEGTLIFQGSGTQLGITRIKLEWLESRQDLVSSSTAAMLVTASNGTTVSADEVNGQPAKATDQAGAWDGDVVTVPVATDPVRIEQGVEFSVDLDKVPTTARVALKESGLALSQHLVVWINEQRAGTLTPSVPGLNDGGFFTDSTSTTNYVGWRDGSFYVPVTMLKEGVNTIQFSPEDDQKNATAATNADDVPPLALKSVGLQLNYAAPPQLELPVLHLSAEPVPVTSSDTDITTPGAASAGAYYSNTIQP